MRIIFLNEKKKERRLYVPNALLSNRLTSFWIVQSLEKHGIYLSHKQIRRFAECINDVRKRHPDWVFLELTEKGGEKIKIIL